jgi:hypothetical protein
MPKVVEVEIIKKGKKVGEISNVGMEINNKKSGRGNPQEKAKIKLAKEECSNYVNNSCNNNGPCKIIQRESCTFFDKYVLPLLK